MIIVGFTGTRKGMSDDQARQLRYVLTLLRHADAAQHDASTFMDGDCPDGADRSARNIATSMGWKADPRPPKDDTAAAMLARDRVIADTCHVLIACPLTDYEQQRSGTWATVRYARDGGKPVVMLTRGGRRPASDERLLLAMGDEAKLHASTIAVEVLSRMDPDEDLRQQMRAYLRRKTNDLLRKVWEVA